MSKKLNLVSNELTLDTKNYIVIKGARVHNLKNIDLAIPRNQLIVITGLSGSGKSSLAFDTLFAEGQRMYVESLNSYARQFLGRMEKPDVDYIKGVSPAIAIEQKVNNKNPRSTVGTTTEIYDYLKLLFARVGKTYSPITNQIVKKDTVTTVVDFIATLDLGQKFLILTPLKISEGRTLQEELSLLLQKGYSRILVNDTMHNIEDLGTTHFKDSDLIYVLIDRDVVKKEEEQYFRWSDSIQSAFFEGHGQCVIDVVGQRKFNFSDAFELDGIKFEEPTVNFFSFNNPYGACKRCEGFGHVLGIDPDLVIPDKTFSVFEGAIAPWKGEKMKEWLEPLVKHAIKFDFPIHRPYEDLTAEQQELLWTGNKYFQGLHAFFEYLETQTYKIQYRVMLSRFRGRTVCPECKGTRLRGDADYVKFNNHSIIQLVLMPIDQLLTFFKSVELNAYDLKVSERLVKEITNRLTYLEQVGLGYLTLNRLTSTLSGGEFQRIKLATSLGSALVGSMYILDEPSIGLHPRDTKKLVEVLKTLRDIGNTVIVVEHEEDVIRAADQLIDIGPDAGRFGGNLIFQGTFDELPTAQNSHTADYLLKRSKIELPSMRRKWNAYIELSGVKENNLKNIQVKFPLHTFTVVTGVSGSGKSTLVKKIFYPAIQKALGQVGEFNGKFESIKGDLASIQQVEFIDQNPIGKSSRSNPVTYIKAFDLIRNLYAEQPLSKTRAYKPGYFSFNVEGGRCEFCQGEGEITVEMQFMADVHLTCESCKGMRYKQEVLEILYNGKNISEILNLTVEESVQFFSEKPKIKEKLLPLIEVGLGYVKLGQSSSSLSGGEAQRVKLASFLGKNNESSASHILFLFDEPTTGLHFHDIKKLLNSIQALVNNGHSVLVIEHNMEMIKSADWVIDLGPEGGNDGGYIVFEGTPEEMKQCNKGYTATYLKDKLEEA
jgi:excinuclease ABC subunit A